MVKIYLVNGCKVQITIADYGFAFCRIERYCMGPESIADVLAEIDHLALIIGKQIVKVKVRTEGKK